MGIIRLAADDSNEISSLTFSEKIQQNILECHLLLL